MKNYFNTLSEQEKRAQLGVCDFMNNSEFSRGVNELKGKKIVILGCGSQGLNQGLNLRDSGLNVSFALRESSIENQNNSWLQAVENGFQVGTFPELIPSADLVINLTPDKQHSPVLKAVLPLMKHGAALSYSHGFNVVEEGMEIQKDITVILVAPKCPGTEVREEYKRGFGVPTLIAVHPENDPEGRGLELAKAYAVGIGSHKAGVLKSSFVAEVKSDLMGEQTILCGVLQSASILCFDKMCSFGIERSFAAGLIQYGWEHITEALKLGGVTAMMDRLSNPAKLRAFELSEELKSLFKPLFQTHMDRILSGEFSREMMEDWKNNDAKLLRWREETGQTAFEQSEAKALPNDQAYFDCGTLLVAFVRAGVELAFEIMVEGGIKAESAYYESLHELPLIANTIARKKLYEMNKVISDTAEYGCYLFDQACKPLLANFMQGIEADVLGGNFNEGKDNGVPTKELIAVNKIIRSHPIEEVGLVLREAMTEMKARYELKPAF